MRRKRWQEVALWFPAERILVSADALGSLSYFSGRSEPFGVHPFLRLFPPKRALAGLEPSHLLFGHGEGYHGEDGGDALAEALRTARRRLPHAFVSFSARARAIPVMTSRTVRSATRAVMSADPTAVGITSTTSAPTSSTPAATVRAAHRSSLDLSPPGSECPFPERKQGRGRQRRSRGNMGRSRRSRAPAARSPECPGRGRRARRSS